MMNKWIEQHRRMKILPESELENIISMAPSSMNFSVENPRDFIGNWGDFQDQNNSENRVGGHPKTEITSTSLCDVTEITRMIRAYNYTCRAQLDIEMLDAEIGLQNEVEGLRQHLGARVAKQYLVWLFGEPVEPTPKEVLVELLEELRPESTA